MARFDPPAFGTQSPADTMPAPVRGGNVAPPNGWGGRPLKQVVVTTDAATGVNGVALDTQPVGEIRNALGVKIDSATDVVTAEVMSGNAKLLGTTSVTAVAGVWTFTDLEIESYDEGTVHLMFRAAGAYPGRQYTAIDNLPGVAASMAFVTAPVGGATTEVLTVQPVIRLLDSTGRVATGDSTSDIVATKGSGTGTLSGTDTVTAVAGIVTFTDLVMTTAGTYTLDFDTGALTTLSSGTLTTSA